jgi:hypothetical protein
MMRCGGGEGGGEVGDRTEIVLCHRVVGRDVMCVQWAWPIRLFA